ncbi:MAG: hypothetical protein WA666_13655 [Nitrospirota bacterium]
MRKGIFLLLAYAFLLATMVAVGHFHDDGCDHDGCPKCIVLHHSKSPDIVFENIDFAPKIAAIDYVILQANYNFPVRQITPSEIRPPTA